VVKIEDATNEQLDVLVAEKMMEWTLIRCTSGGNTVVGFDEDTRTSRLVCPPEGWSGEGAFRPSTDIACAFQVDKPEWEWRSDELGSWYAGGWRLRLGIWDDGEYLADITILLDPANKTAAYCRGRCIAALKACGVTEV